MLGRVPGSHGLRATWPSVDGRDKAGHDAVRPSRRSSDSRPARKDPG